jgi:hypothetical protein
MTIPLFSAQEDVSTAGLSGRGQPISAARRRILIGLVVGVNALAAAGCPLLLAEHPRSEDLEALLVAEAVGQGSLLPIWAALGGKRTPWRFAGAVAAIAALTLLLQKFLPGPDAQVWGYFLLAQMIGTSVPLLLLRFFGLRVSRVPAEEVPRQAFRLQFSLRSMLEWTAAVAVLCGMLQVMPEGFRRAFVSIRWYEPACAFAVFGGLAALWLWVALGARWLGARLILLGFTLPMAGIVLASLGGPAGASTVFLLPVALAVWLLGSLWVVRLAGYRLRWR